MKFKKLFSFFLMLMLLVSVLSINTFAEEVNDSPENTYDFVINDFDCTYYNNDGQIVFNNHGTVYNNGNCGVVYNNGGVVYNNGGTVYNNCGTVYNNSGTVFNNCGEVAVNGADGIVVDNTASPVTEEPTAEDETISEAEIITESEENPMPEEAPRIEEAADTIPEEPEALSDGRYKIHLAADYSRFAYLEGPDKSGLDYAMTEEDEIIITAKPGFTLLNSYATTGRCTLQEDGSVVFSAAERDGTLTLVFSVDPPIISPAFGTYGEAVSVKIIVPNGVTMYYTTDGEKYVNESCDVYESPIEIASSCTLQVMAAAEGAESSRVVSGRYLIPIIKAPQFDAVKKGYEPVEPQAITVENNGLDKLKIENVRLTGSNTRCFTLSTENGARVEPGQRDRSTWLVAPVDALSPGTYKAAAEFSFFGGSTATVDLSFTVTE